MNKKEPLVGSLTDSLNRTTAASVPTEDSFPDSRRVPESLANCMRTPEVAQALRTRGGQENKLRLLVVIASYGRNQDRYLEEIVREYKRMPYKVDVIVTSNVEKPVPAGVQLVIGMPSKNPWSLPFAHKKVMAERVADYDLFIYSENDTLISTGNIESFLRVSEVLPENEIPGFLLYEDGPTGARRYAGIHGRFHWDVTSVCRRGPYTFAFLTNEHSACYLLTQRQLRQAIGSGGFLVPPHHGKYDLACTASTDPYTSCGFRKLVCISHVEDFLVHHLPDKYTGREFTPEEQSFDKQREALLAIAREGGNRPYLLPIETKLPDLHMSKEYYEPVKQEVIGAIPGSVQSLLSVGSGSGATERWFVQRMRQVTAIPLDPAIGACLEGSGVELVHGDYDSALRSLDGRKFQALFFSNTLHLVPNPGSLLRKYTKLLEPGGYVLLLTPNVATLRNNLTALLDRPAYRRLRDFEQGGVQFVSLARVRKWLAFAGLSLEDVRWITTPRFRGIVQSLPALFGPWFGTEIIVLGQKQFDLQRQV